MKPGQAAIGYYCEQNWDRITRITRCSSNVETVQMKKSFFSKCGTFTGLFCFCLKLSKLLFVMLVGTSFSCVKHFELLIINRRKVCYYFMLVNKTAI